MISLMPSIHLAPRDFSKDEEKRNAWVVVTDSPLTDYALLQSRSGCNERVQVRLHQNSSIYGLFIVIIHSSSEDCKKLKVMGGKIDTWMDRQMALIIEEVYNVALKQFRGGSNVVSREMDRWLDGWTKERDNLPIH
ncbi:hypothetical protein EGR_03931 [Echinococcus granulosus]|uniref:Uncharacterized protein n=1 Tax=Echinococcus granulosus TaxID=6210 RepID=W6UJD7_ECHGR|nr:hypothetical protein EGR_03931 [Echinococcus granulosus]EUB61256.1 hypothetical protein EGR_03931 [Echinococcus granulosus]